MLPLQAGALPNSQPPTPRAELVGDRFYIGIGSGVGHGYRALLSRNTGAFAPSADVALAADVDVRRGVKQTSQIRGVTSVQGSAR